MTADVTQLHPPLTHFPSCDRDVYGRAVAWYMEGDPDLITAENIRGFVRGWREAGEPCGCLGVRIKAAQDVVTRADKAWRASTTDVNATRLVAAKAELARLRGMA